LTSHDKKGNTGEKTGAYLPEVAHPWVALRAAGYHVDLASPKGGQPPLDGVDRKDPAQAAFLDDPEMAEALAHTLTPAQAAERHYRAVFFAGGHGTMWDFPDAKELADLAAETYERGGVVGAVCHGPAARVNLRLSSGEPLVAGKEVAAFTNDEERAVKLDHVVPFLLADALVERGARHRPGPMWKPNVVVSERLVTGQNPASAKGVGEEMARLLGARPA
jgi:putative intracellular protease/amidase